MFNELIVMVIIAVLANALNIRICIFYNLFGIPCPGCGLTRSGIYFLKGDYINSIKYNILGIPVVLAIIFYFILFLLNRHKIVNDFFNKHKIIMIIILILILIIVEIININNPLLY